MASKNRYSRNAKISEGNVRHLFKLFSMNLEATHIAGLICLNRNTVNRYLRAIRERMAEHCEEQSPFSCEVEVDESFFGAHRVKGKRGQGAYGKTIVFGIFKRNGKVYTQIIPNDPSPFFVPLTMRGYHPSF